MIYYTLGRSGLRISRLALGTMTFGEEWGWGADQSGSRAIFDKYLEAGGNFIDTADLYTEGNSERLLGKFMTDANCRDDVVISTNFTFNDSDGKPNNGGNGRKNILRAVEGSLERLQTDYLDLYIMHAWDRFTPVEEVMSTLDDLITSGKVRHVAISDAPAWYISRAQTISEYCNYDKFIALQLEYSLLERNIEHEFVPLGQETGAGIMAWSPLGGGLLSGKYKPSEDGASGEGRLATMQESGNPAFDKFNERNWKIVQTLEDVSRKLGRPMAQVAINWVANQPGIAATLIGASKLPQLEDNLQALDFTIDPELLDQLNEVSKPPTPFPYTFFSGHIQEMVSGGAEVSNKPSGYTLPALLSK